MTVARVKGGATHLQLAAFKLMSHHNNHIQVLTKSWMNSENLEKSEKKWPNNILMYPVEAHLWNPALHEALGSRTTGSLGPGPGDPPDVVMGQKFHSRYLQSPPRWQRGEAALSGAAVQVLFNGACGLSRFMCLPPLVSHSEFGASSRSDRVSGTFPPVSWMQISSTAALTVTVWLHLGQQLLSVAHQLYRKWHPNKMVTNPLKFCLNMKRSDKVDKNITHTSGQWKGETSAFALVLTLVEFRILKRLSRKFPFASPKQASHNANTCLSTAYSTKLFPSFHLAFTLSSTSDKSFM